MQQYTLTDARNRHGEVFDKATIEPVLLTKQARPSHVIMSAATYQHLMARLAELEDRVLGQAATEALSQSQFMGEPEFIAALKQLANGKT